MGRTTRFTPEEPAERDLEPYVPEKYGDVYFGDCEVRTARVAIGEPHYRTTITTVDDDRIFALGLTSEDLNECDHVIVERDRFGYGRCRNCRGHFFSAGWVAAGLYGLADDTIDVPLEQLDDSDTWAYAATTAARYADRLVRPSLSIVRTGV